MAYSSIDRLTIVGYPTDYDPVEEYLNHSSFFTHENQVRSTLYQSSYSGRDGSFVQIRDSGHFRLPLRLDFNPNNAEESEIKGLLTMFERSHVTRIDIAVDYPGLRLGDYLWTIPSGISYRVYYGRGHSLECIEIGGKSSNKKWRIYDKTPRGGKPICRVESQTRRPQTNLLRLNMFEGIAAVSEFRAATFKDRAIIDYLRKFPQEMSQLSPNTRKKYRMLLADTSRRTLMPQPQDQYLRDRAQLDTDLNRWLSYTSDCFASCSLIALEGSGHGCQVGRDSTEKACT